MYQACQSALCDLLKSATHAVGHETRFDFQIVKPCLSYSKKAHILHHRMWILLLTVQIFSCVYDLTSCPETRVRRRKNT